MPSVLPGYHKERDDVCVCNAKAHLCQPELQQVCEMYWELNMMMVSERQVGIWGGGREGKGKVWEERNFSNTMHLGWRDTKQPWGKEAQERWQNMEQGLAKQPPWLSAAVAWLQLTQHPPGPTGAWSSQPSQTTGL